MIPLAQVVHSNWASKRIAVIVQAFVLTCGRFEQLISSLKNMIFAQSFPLNSHSPVFIALFLCNQLQNRLKWKIEENEGVKKKKNERTRKEKKTSVLCF